MPTAHIRYRSGYKYQLAFDYSIDIGIKPKKDIDTKFIKLDTQGRLTIRAGYAWDGPSGPVIDRTENMRASLVHDALYQLMRNRKLTAKLHKDKADRLFKKICMKDGVPERIARAYYWGLKLGGKPSTDPKNKKKIHRAP
ncbi:MAG: DUF1353 domain-containing protein [Planctomycetota bacterium]|jgi:hypothetical protein